MLKTRGRASRRFAAASFLGSHYEHYSHLGVRAALVEKEELSGRRRSRHFRSVYRKQDTKDFSSSMFNRTSNFLQRRTRAGSRRKHGQDTSAEHLHQEREARHENQNRRKTQLGQPPGTKKDGGVVQVDACEGGSCGPDDDAAAAQGRLPGAGPEAALAPGSPAALAPGSGPTLGEAGVAAEIDYESLKPLLPEYDRRFRTKCRSVGNGDHWQGEYETSGAGAPSETDCASECTKLGGASKCFGYTYWEQGRAGDSAKKCELHKKLITHTQGVEPSLSVLCAVKLTEGIWNKIGLGWSWKAGEGETFEAFVDRDFRIDKKNFGASGTKPSWVPRTGDITASIVNAIAQPWSAKAGGPVTTKSVKTAYALCDEANFAKHDNAKYEWVGPPRPSMIFETAMATAPCGVLANFNAGTAGNLQTEWQASGHLTYRSCRSACARMVGCDLYSFTVATSECLLGRGLGNPACEGQWKRVDATGFLMGVCNRWALCGQRFGSHAPAREKTNAEKFECDNGFEFRPENKCNEQSWEAADDGSPYNCKRMCCAPQDRGRAVRALFVGNSLTFAYGAAGFWRPGLARYVEEVVRGFGEFIEIDEDTVANGLVHAHLTEVLSPHTLEYNRPRYESETGQVCKQHPISDAAPLYWTSSTGGPLACPQKGLLREIATAANSAAPGGSSAGVNTTTASGAAVGAGSKGPRGDYTRSYYDVIQLQDHSLSGGLASFAANYLHSSCADYSRLNEDTLVASYMVWNQKNAYTDLPDPDPWQPCSGTVHGVVRPLDSHTRASPFNDGKHLDIYNNGNCAFFPDVGYGKAAADSGGICWAYSTARGYLHCLEHGARATIPTGLAMAAARGYGRTPDQNTCFRDMNAAWYDKKVQDDVAGGPAAARSTRGVKHAEMVLGIQNAIDHWPNGSDALYKDRIHPKPVAQYLAAVTWYATMYNKDPTDCDAYRKGGFCGTTRNLFVSPADARKVQAIVKYTLTDRSNGNKWSACNFWANENECGTLHLRKSG